MAYLSVFCFLIVKYLRDIFLKEAQSSALASTQFASVLKVVADPSQPDMMWDRNWISACESKPATALRQDAACSVIQERKAVSRDDDIFGHPTPSEPYPLMRERLPVPAMRAEVETFDKKRPWALFLKYWLKPANCCDGEQHIHCPSGTWGARSRLRTYLLCELAHQDMGGQQDQAPTGRQ